MNKFMPRADHGFQDSRGVFFCHSRGAPMCAPENPLSSKSAFFSEAAIRKAFPSGEGASRVILERSEGSREADEEK